MRPGSPQSEPWVRKEREGKALLCRAWTDHHHLPVFARIQKNGVKAVGPAGAADEDDSLPLCSRACKSLAALRLQTAATMAQKAVSQTPSPCSQPTPRVVCVEVKVQLVPCDRHPACGARHGAELQPLISGCVALRSPWIQNKHRRTCSRNYKFLLPSTALHARGVLYCPSALYAPVCSPPACQLLFQSPPVFRRPIFCTSLPFSELLLGFTNTQSCDGIQHLDASQMLRTRINFKTVGFHKRRRIRGGVPKRSLRTTMQRPRLYRPPPPLHTANKNETPMDLCQDS